MARTKAPYSLLYSNDPAAAAWRAKQADLDADIEGLSRDHEADRMIADMDARRVDPRQQIERLGRYFMSRRARQRRVRELSSNRQRACRLSPNLLPKYLATSGSNPVPKSSRTVLKWTHGQDHPPIHRF